FRIGDTDAAENGSQRGHPIVHILRLAARQNNTRLGGAQHVDSRGMDQVVKNAYVARKWNALHRIGNVLVERREETEAVFAGKIFAAVDACVGDRDAAGLASEDVILLIYRYFEAAFHEFVRGTQAGDTASKNRNLVWHDPLLYCMIGYDLIEQCELNTRASEKSENAIRLRTVSCIGPFGSGSSFWRPDH